MLNILLPYAHPYEMLLLIVSTYMYIYVPFCSSAVVVDFKVLVHICERFSSWRTNCRICKDHMGKQELGKVWMYGSLIK